MPTKNNNKQEKTSAISTKQATQKLDQLQKEADKTRSKSAGSQSNSSDRHNTGRGGGK